MNRPDGGRRARRRPARPAGRRLLLAALLVAALAGALEAGSHLLWWASEGSRFSAAAVERLAAEAAAGRRQTTARREADAAAQRRRETAAAGVAPYLREESLHPFLGYVVDPDVELLAEDPFPGLTVTPHGFLALDGDSAPRRPGPPPLRVAVFGGSVAYVFTLHGRDGLARGLAAGGVVPPGGIEIVGRALGGWKQPQQLMALAWFLAHGERYDAVVVLDGFNELALSKLENADARLNPFYPRAWRLRVRGLPDADLEERIGELSWLRRRRAARAEGFAASPGRRSATAGVVWRALDRRAASSRRRRRGVGGSLGAAPPAPLRRPRPRLRVPERRSPLPRSRRLLGAQLAADARPRCRPRHRLCPLPAAQPVRAGLEAAVGRGAEARRSRRDTRSRRRWSTAGRTWRRRAASWRRPASPSTT
jgi:hypothetical protein